MVKIDSKQFYTAHDSKKVKRISFQRQARVNVQNNNEHIIYTRKIHCHCHCHCKMCRNYICVECEFILKGYEMAKWQKQDISLVGRDKNVEYGWLKYFYSNFNANESELLLLTLPEADTQREHYRFARLNSKPYKLSEQELKGKRDINTTFKSDNIDFMF